MHQLKVINIQKTIPEASVVTFEIPKDKTGDFQFKPGQYITLEFNLDGETVRRSYSLCCSPKDGVLQVGVKRVKGGLVSNHINDNLKVGDTVNVLPPDGKFFAEIDSTNYKSYYLFAAGSGITPILSILKTVLTKESNSCVYLIYGNKHQESIMFKKELDELEKQYVDRLVIVHSLSSPKSKWSDLWTTPTQEFRKGRVDADAVRWMINTYPPYAQNAEYYICGPGKMIESTKKTLRSLDVPESRIFSENFGGGKADSAIEGVENAKLTATLNGSRVETTIARGKTVLRALIDAGAKPPYSCEGGVCSTCKCQLTNGKVEMKINLALTEKEVEDGYILSCQSVPMAEEVTVVY